MTKDKLNDTTIADLFIAAFGLIAGKFTARVSATSQNGKRQYGPTFDDAQRAKSHSRPPPVTAAQQAAARAMGFYFTPGASEHQVELILAWRRDPFNVAAANAISFASLTNVHPIVEYWQDPTEHPIYQAVEAEFSRRDPQRVAKRFAGTAAAERAGERDGQEFRERMDALRTGAPPEYQRVIAERDARNDAYDEKLRISDPRTWARRRYRINKDLVAQGADPNTLPGPIEPGLPIDRIGVTRFPRNGLTSRNSLALH